MEEKVNNECRTLNVEWRLLAIGFGCWLADARFDFTAKAGRRKEEFDINTRILVFSVIRGITHPKKPR